MEEQKKKKKKGNMQKSTTGAEFDATISSVLFCFVSARVRCPISTARNKRVTVTVPGPDSQLEGPLE